MTRLTRRSEALARRSAAERERLAARLAPLAQRVAGLDRAVATLRRHPFLAGAAAGLLAFLARRSLLGAAARALPVYALLRRL